MIIADSREPKHLLNRIQEAGIELQIKELDVGDYVLPDDTVIERKTNDFFYSLISGRLWDQLSNLRQAQHPILVIQTSDLWKSMYFIKSPHIHKSFFGAIATAALNGIPVITVKDAEEFVLFLKALHDKLEKGKGQIKLHQKKGKTLEEIKINLLAAIPGISLKKAESLLEHFKTIQNIANAEIADIQSVSGIGKTLAEKIWEVMRK